MTFRPLSRRTLLRGAGVTLALPFLEAMAPTRARAQAATPQRFFAFFYPNGTDPSQWEPTGGALSPTSLPACLVDLAGFESERIWPAQGSIVSDVTVVTGIDHSGVCTDIHVPSLALSAHKGTKNNFTPGAPTLDQYLADPLRGGTPFRNLALSATPSTDIAQGTLSFREDGQPETIIRSPRQLFTNLFGKSTPPTDGATGDGAQRQKALLDLVLADATRLRARLGRADQDRLDQYLTAVDELETQLEGTETSECVAPAEPPSGGDWHTQAKLFIDLAVLAFACDLTRVVALQYSDSWGVNYPDYVLGDGIMGVGDWSDHFISHKLDDTDRATDLDGLDRAEAMRIANARVIATSRFKVRRYAYLVDQLKKITTPNGTLLDESLVLYASENGDGDSHARTRMPVLLAGHAGQFVTGRTIAAPGKNTGSLHASILERFGLDVSSYGDPMGTPIADF
jgi:Protein of unknown function (DUF1552)